MMVFLEDAEQFGGFGQDGLAVEVTGVGHLKEVALVGVCTEVPELKAAGAGHKLVGHFVDRSVEEVHVDV